jgi:hypothetical protein
MPRFPRVEQIIGDVGAGLGNRQVECLVDLVFLLCELSVVDCVENCSCVAPVVKSQFLSPTVSGNIKHN